MFRAAYFRFLIILLVISAVCPELTDHQAVRPPLHQIYTGILSVKMVRKTTNRLECDFVAAAWASAAFPMAGLFQERHLPFAVGTVTGFSPALFVVVEYELLWNTNLIDPAIPVLGERRGESHILVPLVRCPLIASDQRFCAGCVLIGHNSIETSTGAAESCFDLFLISMGQPYLRCA